MIQLYCMVSYVTTNIRLLEEDYLRLKEEAARKRKSLSAVIREKISKKLPPEDYAKKLLTIKGKWFTQKEHNQIRKEIEKRLDKYSL